MEKIALSALLSVAVGFFFGAVYDIVRLLRVLMGISVASPFKKKGVRPYIAWIFSSLLDLLFMLFSAACMCVFFFLTGDGRMRGYGLVGAFIGFKIYCHTVGKLFICVVSFLAECVKTARSLIWKKLRRLNTVQKAAAWYNERKLMKETKKRHKKMAKNGCIRNGF